AINGVVKASTPKAIKSAPAIRFLMTPGVDGIGNYPCSIDARIFDEASMGSQLRSTLSPNADIERQRENVR
ncbi:MAG: hypothetical protein WCB77_05760, partial [Pseudolabrys sp.]